VFACADALGWDRFGVVGHAGGWGEADAMIPVERGRRLAEAIPNARFAGLPGVGHTCQVEAPDEFIAAVAPFMDALAAGKH
jgi:pimeloyl-ACP methyl ester carboxylesterase